MLPAGAADADALGVVPSLSPTLAPSPARRKADAV